MLVHMHVFDKLVHAVTVKVKFFPGDQGPWINAIDRVPARVKAVEPEYTGVAQLDYKAPRIFCKRERVVDATHSLFYGSE